MRRDAIVFLSALLFVAATQCNIFVLDAGGLDGTCSFEGDTSAACGRCIAESCRSQVDGCCSDVDCRPALDDLDRCATSSSAQACSALGGADQPKAEALAACVVEACGDVCTTQPDAGVEPCTEESCAEGQGCDHGYCHERCIEDRDCGSYRTCSGNFCSEPVGTPCSEETQCNTSHCLTLNNHAEPVPGYCSIFCSGAGACPSGFECLDYNCYQISAEGPLCPYPMTSPCGACVLDSCGSRIHDCCDHRPTCNWVIDQVEKCDEDRTYESCNDLYDDGGVISDFADYQLLECISENCESRCWNPCPGEGC